MRDYKNVKVPRKYRTRSKRTSVKRVEVRRGGRKPEGASVVKALLNIAGFAVVAALCWAGWQGYVWLTRSEVFQIAGVDVRGVRRLSAADLKNIAGEFTGQNIFRVDLGAAVRRARANPWIRDVWIHRSLPNRITMTLVERVPYAVLDTGAGRYFIDNEAVVIGRASGDLAASLPAIAIRDCRARPGEPATADAVPDALALLAEIEERGGWNIAGVTLRAGSPEALSILYADHEFRIGSGNYSEKLRRLAEILKDVKHRNLSFAYVDLRPARQAALMPAGNGRKTFQRR